MNKETNQNYSFLFFVIILFAITPVLLTSNISSAGYRDVCPSSMPGLPKEARISERIFGLEGLSKAGRVSPNIYRGSQPLPEGYSTLKRMGIKTVINLRSRHSEKKAVEAEGMRSIEIPLSVFDDVGVKTVNRIIEIMADPGNQPVYVHCKLGQDRTGVVIAAYRMKVDGWSLKEAEAEMQAFGFNDLWLNLKLFIMKHAKPIGK